jgi:endonuclease/exonuclease/phosphatase family metal-dependent hydrolase
MSGGGGCAARHDPGANDALVGSRLTLLTYNVNFGGPAPELALDAIERADADVVCLQETTDAWEQAIRVRFAARYPHMRFNDPGAAGGSGILSKHPLSRVEFVETQAGWFPACLAMVETPGGPILITGVHLRPPVSDRGSFASGYFTTPPVRRAEIKEIHAAAAERASGAPVVIAGDFNESDNGSAVRWLTREQGYVDALRSFDRYSSTWHWQVGPLPLSGRLDHVAVGPGLRAVEAQVMKEGMSDHYPVRVVLERQANLPARPTSSLAVASSRTAR